MASYGEWNKSIAAYFTAGIAKGSPVFLTVDEDSLFEIAQYFMEGSVDDDPVNDFFKAIRQKCVVSHTISISAIKGSDSEGIPNCVAFLGALVFAAYKMQQEEDVGVTNYFLRLREVLFDPPFGQGRPEGFPVGCEAGLWKAWNIYLVNLGFRTTAEEGAGPHKFIYYALSQPILRECDKRLLRIFFNEAQLPNFDCERLGYWLSRKQINQQHLREGFHHPDSGRLWEFYRAAHRVYESEDWKNTENQSKRKEKTINKIQCGLYLIEDRATGESQYLIFPQQPRGMRFATLSVEQEKDVHRKLRPLKGGFFYPLWEQTPFVDNPQLFSVKGNQNIQHMVFPKRDYWILMRDPDESEFGSWASWKPTPDLGEHFLLLCREGAFRDEMTRLRSSKLIDWAERNVHNGFIEFVDCMVCSFDVKWHTPASPECSDLVDALTPRMKTKIALLGGLRDPNQSAWIEGFAPAVKIYGFENKYSLELRRENSSFSYEEKNVEAQKEIQLPSDSLIPGTYQIEAKCENKIVDSMRIRIIAWNDIQKYAYPEEISNQNPISTGGLHLRGAFLQNSIGERPGDAL